MHAAIIPADINQPIRFETIENTLEPMQKIVGGDIQLVGLRALAMNLYLNEEGKYMGLGMNSRATTICHEYQAIRRDDYIVGDVFLVGPYDENGADTDLSPEQQTWLTAVDQSFGIAKTGEQG